MRKIWIVAAIYACVLSLVEAYRWHIWSFGSDTGTFTQAILASGNGFHDGPERGSHYLYHFSPILAALYPPIALTHSPLVLQIFQVVFIALTAPAMYALFTPYVGERVAGRLALVTLLYPPLAGVAFGEFHELAFLPPLVVVLVWAADRCRWVAFAAIGATMLLIREDACLEIAAVGVGVSLFALLGRRTSRQSGLLLGEPREPAATSLAFGALAVAGGLVAFFYFRDVIAVYGRWPHGHFYDYHFARTATGVAALLQGGRLTYLLEALAPLVFLPLRSRWALAAIPGFVIVLGAAEQSVWRMGNHYAALWAPWVLISAGAAVARIQRGQGEASAIRWSYAALATCVVVLIAFDPLHPVHYLTPPYRDLASARAALACVPPGASLSTHDEWFSEISAGYPNATIEKTDGPQYLVYADDFSNDEFAHVLRPQLAADVRARRYRVVCSFGQVKTYRRQAQ